MEAQFMRWLLTRIGEFRLKRWLDNHSSDVLAELGVAKVKIN